MKIAVDKNTIKAISGDNNEYIYLFNDEPYQELLNTKLHCIHYKHCKFVDINLTDYNVECIKKTKPTEKDWNKIEFKDYKIAIIVPNYNYEHTLEKCLNSILEQTYKNYEIIFVDDVSTDNSVEIAKRLFTNYLKKEYKDFDTTNELSNKFKIIQLKQKRYNGGARNEAYLHLSDDVDYVWYVDSDDWLLDNKVLEDINDRLITNPDVLFIGMSEYRNFVTKTCFIPTYKDKYEAIAGWSGSCGKVIKKELATRQECLYNEGTLKEDRNQHCKICIYMNSFELLERPVYVWNKDNMKSVTHIRDEIVWGTSTIRHLADTKQLYLSVRGNDPKIDEYLEYRLKLCEDEVRMGNDRQW